MKSLMRKITDFFFRVRLRDSSAAAISVPRPRGLVATRSRITRITCALPERGGM